MESDPTPSVVVTAAPHDAGMHADWYKADYYIPVVVYHDGSIDRLAPRPGFWQARDAAVHSARHYVEAFRPEHNPVCYVEPTTLAQCLAHTRHDAHTTPLYRYAIIV